MTHPKPVVLCILDGWGISTRPEQSAPAQAQTIPACTSYGSVVTTPANQHPPHSLD